MHSKWERTDLWWNRMVILNLSIFVMSLVVEFTTSSSLNSSPRDVVGRRIYISAPKARKPVSTGGLPLRVLGESEHGQLSYALPHCRLNDVSFDGLADEGVLDLGGAVQITRPAPINHVAITRIAIMALVTTVCFITRWGEQRKGRDEAYGRVLAIIVVVFSSRTVDRVFVESVEDARAEYLIALSGTQSWYAWWVYVRGFVSIISTVVNYTASAVVDRIVGLLQFTK